MTGAAYAAVVAFFVASGAQPYQGEAFARMGMIESRLMEDPPHTGLGHCMLQWVGTRWEALQRFGHTRGRCPPMRVQLMFAWHEVRSARYGCFWRAPPRLALPVLRRTFGAGGPC